MALCNGERLTPFATKPLSHSGACSSTWRASDSVSNSAKTQAPVPVRRDGAYSNSQESTASTSRKRFLAITSQSLLNSHFSNVSIDLFGVLRGSSGSLKITGVGILTPGCATKYHFSGGSTGVSISPTPSANAACPRTKTGTSAPSVSPHFRQFINA